MSGDRYERLETIKQEVAERLKLPATSDKVEEVAILKLLREAELEKLMIGKHIDTRAFLDLTRTLSELTPPVIPTVELQIVGRDGQALTMDEIIDRRRRLTPSPTETPISDAPDSNAAPAESGPVGGQSPPTSDDAKPNAAPSVDNVVQLPEKKPPLWEKTGYTPAQPFHEGAPLKPPEEAWRRNIEPRESSLHDTLNPPSRILVPDYDRIKR